MIKYLGSFEIVSFEELDDVQQAEELSLDATAGECQYIVYNDVVLSLNVFLCGGAKGFDGSYCTSNYGGYLIKVDSRGDGVKLYDSY